MSAENVLVVGAGPAGLTAAAELLRRGVPVELVDKAAGPSGLSKALAIWPRTVELLRRLGAQGPVETWSLPQAALRYYSSGRVVGEIGFRDDRLRPLAFPQPAVESLLGEAVHRFGGSVQWSTTVETLTQDEGAVTVRLSGPDGPRTRQYAYVIGADGAGSVVRTQLGVSFEGMTHELGFVVADIALDTTLQPDMTHYFCSPKGILVACGLPDGRWRVFTSGPPGMRREDVGLELVQQLVDERGPGGLRLTDPEWISVFAVHARHAGEVRRGRVFLIGDAAHIHSPAGGQGLNTGVADAHNLAWKLALVARGEARPELLDSFAAERGQVARAVIRQAQVQTRIWMLRGYRAGARDLALRVASGLRLFHRAYVPWLAGLRTTYGTALGAGKARHGFRSGALVGDQAVWDARRNRRLPLRAALDDLRYTLLVVSTGSPDATTRALLERVNRDFGATVDLRVLDPRAGVLSDAGGEGAGRTTDLLLVRPDGYLDAVVPAAGGAAVLARLRSVLRAASPVPAPSSMADM